MYPALDTECDLEETAMEMLDGNGRYRRLISIALRAGPNQEAPLRLCTNTVPASNTTTNVASASQCVQGEISNAGWYGAAMAGGNCD